MYPPSAIAKIPWLQPLAAQEAPFVPDTFFSRVEHSLAAGDAQRQWLQGGACRMAISRNASSFPDFPEFAQAVRYAVPELEAAWYEKAALIATIASLILAITSIMVTILLA